MKCCAPRQWAMRPACRCTAARCWRARWGRSIASAHGFACLPRLSWGTELFGPLLLKDDIVANPPRYADFELELPDGPGLGLTLDEDKLNFYRRDR